VLLKQKELEDAEADLDEALSLVPQHAPALLLLGDLAYRNQSWEQARAIFARLAAAPGAGAIVTPELLAFRRAELADMFGDEEEAEAAYREVAELNPRHVEAREALAQIAAYREDRREAGRRLEELLRLYPPDASEKIAEARERLGEIRAALGDDEAARHQLELLLAEHPNRLAALETLAAVHERLGRHREAAEAFGRLGRLYADPRQKAEALYRQGEILRQRLEDQEAADDAYLRSSDMDPTFPPTLVRLIQYYWTQRDLENVAEVGAELAFAGARSDEVALLIALAQLVQRRDREAAQAVLRDVPVEAPAAADRLAELAHHLGDAAAGPLDRAIDLLLEGERAGLAPGLHEALGRAAGENPARRGAAAALERLARRG
jgi:tetratricopeptide (TPR) repeat protein